MSKFFKVLSTAGLAAALMVGCGDAEITTVDQSGETKQEAKGDKEVKQQTEFKIGETVSIDGMEITLSKVTFGQAAEYSPAEKGKILKVEGTAKNNSNSNGYIDNIEFMVYADDQKTDYYYGYTESNNGIGELKKGKSSNITLAFDVPDAEVYEIYYEPSFTLSENAEIKWIVPKGEIK